MTRKASQVLFESQEKRNQIRGMFVERHGDPNIGDIVGYCVTGALLCEMGAYANIEGTPINPREQIEAEYGISAVETSDSEEIDCPYYDNDACEGYSTTFDIIVHLNDYHKLSFKEIGQYLQEMGY